jgi:L-lactate dehydrogenase complex protein LldE
MNGPTVQLFVTCLVDGFYPQVGVAAIEVLERVGCRVEFPFGQTCCGQPAFNAGFRPEARRMIEYSLSVLDPTEGPIVVPSGSCADMLIHHGPELVSDSPELAATAARVAARVRELTSFLVDDLGVTDLEARMNARVAFHRSCHGLRNLGLSDQADRLLSKVAGLSICPLAGAEVCCGFGGLFSVEMPDVSAAMMAAKLSEVEASGAEVLVGGDVSCLMHLAGGLRRRGSSIRVRHIAEVLAGDAS